MAEPEEILVAVERALRGATSVLRGCRVLVTAGPTREALDPIRVLTNRSSGRMGYALAAEAHARGAEVTLISGPTTIEPPCGVTVERVETTTDLANAMSRHLPEADVLLMAAAPADFAAAEPAAEKRPRRGGDLTVALVPTPDVLEHTRGRRKKGATIVGFAYETGDGVRRAREKLERKGLDIAVLNMAAPDAGTEVETNRITLVTRDGDIPGPLELKSAAAARVLDAVERLR